MCALGKSPSVALWSRSTWRATVILCTSVGPSAMPITAAPISMAANGISFDTPNDP